MRKAHAAIMALMLVLAVGGSLLILKARRGAGTAQRGQAAEFNCGYWAVLRSCQLLGVAVDQGDLIEGLPPNEAGHSLLQLANTLESCGLIAEARRETWESLDGNTGPWIAHLQDPNHFVVVCSIEPQQEYLHVFDGAGRRVRQSRNAFQRRWSGVALHIKRSSAGTRCAETGARIRFDTLLHDKGAIRFINETVPFVYRFRNVGQKDLLIEDVLTSCSCLRVESPETPIPPDRTGTITLYYKVASRRGPFTHSALVRTNDGKTPRVVLHASGFSGAAVTCEPSVVDLGDMIIGRECSAVCYLQSNEQWEDIEVDVSENDLRGAQLIEQSFGGVNGNLDNLQHESRILTLVFRPNAGVGSDVRGNLVLTLKSPYPGRITLPVRGRIASAVRAFPDILDFGVSDPGDKHERQVVLVSRLSDPIETVYVEPIVENVFCETVFSKDRKSVQLRFSASGESALKAAGSRIAVHVRHSDHEATIELPVTARHTARLGESGDGT